MNETLPNVAVTADLLNYLWQSRWRQNPKFEALFLDGSLSKNQSAKKALGILFRVSDFSINFRTVYNWGGDL